MAVSMRMLLISLASLLLTTLAACSALQAELGLSGSETTDAGPAVAEPGGDRFPDVLEVTLSPAGDRIYDVSVTLSSPYDTPQRYADGWRVMDPAGNVLGIHTLLHDHASEQPFTRTQRGVAIPAGIDEITVEGRDQANGFGGLTLSVPVPQP